MNLLISQGQAIRSIFGCSRVTHFMGKLPYRKPTSEMAAPSSYARLDTIVSVSQCVGYEFNVKRDTVTPVTTARWLLLIPQLPPEPAYLRVKVWRRLQRLGAISVKNSVYVLPAS